MDAIKTFFKEVITFNVVDGYNDTYSYNGIKLEESSVAFQKKLQCLYDDALMEIPLLNNDIKNGFIGIIDRYKECQNGFDVPDELCLTSMNEEIGRGNRNPQLIRQRDFVQMLRECVSTQKYYLNEFATAIGYISEEQAELQNFVAEEQGSPNTIASEEQTESQKAVSEEQAELQKNVVEKQGSPNTITSEEQTESQKAVSEEQAELQKIVVEERESSKVIATEEQVKSQPIVLEALHSHKTIALEKSANPTTSNDGNIIKGVRGLAEYLGCGINKAQDIVNSDILTKEKISYRTGRGWRYRKDKLIELLEKDPEVFKKVRKK